MKIRIKGNALRYRLTRTDVSLLAREGYLEEESHFPGGTLIYAIQMAEAGLLTADFVTGKITLIMPKPMVEELITTDKVGFSSRDGDMELLVEKDFTCLDNVQEDQSDHYPNPLAAKGYEQSK